MTSIIITLVIVFYRIPLINIIGDKGMGYYSTALVIYLLLMTCIAYGLPKAASSLLASQCSKGQYGHVYKTVQSILIFSFTAGIALSIAVFAGAEFIATNIMNATQSVYAIRCFAPCLFIVSMLGAFHSIFIGTRIVQISKTATKIEELFVAVLSIIGAFYFTNHYTSETIEAYSALGTAAGVTGGVTIACIFMLIFYYGHHKKLYKLSLKRSNVIKETHWYFIKKIVITMLPFVLTLVVFHLSSLTDYAIFNRIMRVQGHKEQEYIELLGILNGKYEFFISLPLLIVNWYASSKESILNKYGKENTFRKLNKILERFLRYTMLYIIPCVIFMFLYSEPLMNLCFTGNNKMASLMLKAGVVSIIFYSLSSITSAALNALKEWYQVAKNAAISMIIQVISLLIMLIVFEWEILAVVFSRLIFSASLFIFNEHTLREKTGYIMEKKRTFYLPFTGAVIMGVISYIVYFILDVFITDKVATLAVFPLNIILYLLSMIILGGITQREMYSIPGGKFLAPLCKKLHLIT